MTAIPNTKWKDVADARPGGAYPRVTFDYLGARPGFGVHIQQLAACGPGSAVTQVVANANDIVFVSAGLERIHFHIMVSSFGSTHI